MTAAIEVEGLSKTFGDVRALNDLSLLVTAGELFAFVGPNGAGKSTTIRILLALARPTSGRVRVLGLDPMDDDVALHRRVGFLPGDLALFPRLTGRQHLEALERLRGGVDAAYRDHLVERFDASLERPVHELSKGNRQKIGVIAALMSRPDLLVLDEPTSGLDPLMRNTFLELLRETVAEGRTVFLSSHDLDEVQRVADRVALVRQGTVITVDSVDQLVRRLPQHVEVHLHPGSDAVLPPLEGVTVLERQGDAVRLTLRGEPGPLLRTLADLDPVDVTWRPADLEEAFLDLYESQPEDPGRAR